jgi:Immunoglobulin domain
VPPKIAPFSFGDEPLNYGEPISVSCIVTGGDLPITIQWRWNGKLLENAGYAHNVQIESRGKRMSMLFIEAVTAQHIGNYTCSAENSAGVAEQASALRVNGLWMEKTFDLTFIVL